MTDHLKNIQQVADDIKSITIQWATNIAKAGIDILGKEIRRQKFKDVKTFDLFLKQAVKLLKNARATEPMLFNGLKDCLHEYHLLLTKKTSLKEIQEKLYKTCKIYVQDIETEEALRPLIGSKLIKKRMNIMTHCHSGSVVKILVEAHHKQKKHIYVYNTETRPLYQWRKTSLDLLEAKVPNTMIVDGAAPFFVDNLYASDVDIDMFIIGADAITLQGDVFNKIGSFAIAMSAWHSGIPVYIAGSLLKVDPDSTIKIEQRSGKELRPDAPKGLEIVNYSFDIVPAKFITGIITEYGVIKPKDIQKEVKKHYPWLLSTSK